MIQNVEKIVEITGLKRLDSIPQLQQLETHYKIKPSIMGLGVSIIVIILILFSVANSLVMFIVGFLTPAYFTLRAMKISKGGMEDVKFLTYWIIYSATQILSPIVMLFIPSTYWLILRVLTTILLLHPKVEGSRVIYYQLILPSIQKLQNYIDHLMVEERPVRSTIYN